MDFWELQCLQNSETKLSFLCFCFHSIACLNFLVVGVAVVVVAVCGGVWFVKSKSHKVLHFYKKKKEQKIYNTSTVPQRTTSLVPCVDVNSNVFTRQFASPFTIGVRQCRRTHYGYTLTYIPTDRQSCLPNSIHGQCKGQKPLRNTLLRTEKKNSKKIATATTNGVEHHP